MDRENRYKLVEIDLTDDTSVAGGGTVNNQLLQPPVGFIYEAIDFYWNVPGVGGATGAHYCYIQWDAAGTRQIMIAANTDTNGIRYRNQDWDLSSSDAPSSQPSQGFTPNCKIIASNSIPVYFQYKNSLDTAQAGTRTLIIVAKMYREAP